MLVNEIPETFPTTEESFEWRLRIWLTLVLIVVEV